MALLKEGVLGHFFGVLIVLAGMFAPGTLATDPGSDLAPIRTMRRLTQTPEVFVQGAKLTAGDGAADDNFGYSVSLDGDTIVIGAKHDDTDTGIDTGIDSGSAYVFTRNTPGDLASGWTQVQKLTALDGAENDLFGPVSLDGDTIVIGAHGDDDHGHWSGSVYVFTRNTPGDLNSEWTQVQKLTAGNNGEAQSYFGMHFVLDGDTVVVAAHGENINYDPSSESDYGAAYVFTREPGILNSGWTQVAKLTANDGVAKDRLGGGGLSLDGDTLVIGAKGVNGYAGAAYVFARLTSGWAQVQKLTVSDGAAYDYLGSVSIDGDTIVTGAFRDDDKGEDSGSVYVFRRNTPGVLTSQWTQVKKLTAGDGAPGDEFGYSVSLDGDTVVIGAHGDDDNDDGKKTGSVYVFMRDTPGVLTSQWTQVAKLTADDGEDVDVFGFSVSLDGDTMVIGAYADDNDKGSNSGSAYVFTTPPPLLPCTCCERKLKSLGLSVGARDCVP